MAAEGSLALTVAWDGALVTGVTIRSGRPLNASRLLLGMTPSQAADAVPLLFSLCGRAQGAASALAAEAALGLAPGEPALRARRARVEDEAAGEYLWRFLVDWPQLLGLPPRWPLLAEARRLLQARPPAPRVELARLLERHLLGIPPEAWARIADRAGLDAWAGAADGIAARAWTRLREGAGDFGGGPVGFTPVADRAWLAGIGAELDRNPDFPGHPEWRGAALETGALARTRGHPLVADLRNRHGNGVATRFAARLVELVSWITGGDQSAGRMGALALGPGRGLGWVETARGLLLHRAEIERDRIAGYAIVAPTEWNFHPRGALAQGLLGMPAGEPGEAKRRAALLVQALDPCVSWEMEVCRA